MGSSSLHEPAAAAGTRSFLLLGPEERLPLAVLAVAAGFVAVFGLAPSSPVTARAGEALWLVAAIASSLALWRAARRNPQMVAARWGAGVAGLLALFRAEALAQAELVGAAPTMEILAAALGLQVALLAGVLIGEMSRHVARSLELVADAALLAVISGAGAFYILRAGSLELGHGLAGPLAMGVAAFGIVVAAGWAVLVMWAPTPPHAALFLFSAVTVGVALAVDHPMSAGGAPHLLRVAETVGGLALLGTAAMIVLIPRLDGARDSMRPPALLGPWLLGLALLGTAASVSLPAVQPGFRPTLAETAVLGVVVLMVAGLRAFLQLLSMVRTTGHLQETLIEREHSITELHTITEKLRRSEARLRRVLDAAVDGIVELDPAGRIVQVNEAFCAMIGVTEDRLVGRTWPEACTLAGDPLGSLPGLPESGEATMERDSRTVYLEARTSAIATDPPGMLLLIRDVTASRVAEQTIRQLFQFLQDRDEDRTRILQRTNAAIEIERNRIARDLHDGPVQGLSAAALSVETARLMIQSGDVERAAAMLQEISGTLSEEAVNLRRIMSDLRPPVLEERGLIPAVRELCARLQRELAVETSVEARADSRVPQEVETLAYRVVQEALSNVAKHARATRVIVRVEAIRGVLRVEVRDDGAGFDPEDVREFLRNGKVGLASMRERAELAGGTMAVGSARGAGTSVLATLPFDVLGPAPRAAGV